MVRGDIIAEIRDLKAAPEVTPETVKAAERFYAEVQKLNRQLRKTLDIEGLCVGEQQR